MTDSEIQKVRDDLYTLVDQLGEADSCYLPEYIDRDFKRLDDLIKEYKDTKNLLATRDQFLFNIREEIRKISGLRQSQEYLEVFTETIGHEIDRLFEKGVNYFRKEE